MATARRMVATNDYVAKNDTELTFSSTNVIFVPNVDDKSGGDGTFKGVFNGKVGYFPKIYVKDTTVELKGPVGTTTRVKAAHAHEGAEGSEELTFPKDAVMFVVAKVSNEYWKGVWQGKAGLIPSAKVHDASEAPKAEEVKKLAGARCMALKTFVNPDAAGLSFKLGDIVFVPNPSPDADKWQGVSGGVVGAFPVALVIDTTTKTKEELEEIKADEGAKPEEQEALAAFNEWKATRDAALNQ